MELETYARIKYQIKKRLDIDLDHYKDEQMRRRLDSWLVRSGAPGWEEYFYRLDRDPDELARLRNYLTINVSSFFRDKERWNALREVVLTPLLHEAQRTRPLGTGLNIWSAGCSTGPEPYTLLMILDEMARGLQHHILATDLDRQALEKARAGGPYMADEIKNLTHEQRLKYLEPEPPYRVKKAFTRRINFREHNLLADPFPPDLDLIVCRNVVIYFTNQTKDQLYRRFFEALRPGGYLFVGATEIVPRYAEIGFRLKAISFYQKPLS